VETKAVESHDSQTIRSLQPVGRLTLSSTSRRLQENLLMRVLWSFPLRCFIQKVVNTLAHLSCRFVGEGESNDLMGMVNFCQESQETTGEQPGLTRACWSLEVKAAVDV
jgi:hypothetical protein